MYIVLYISELCVILLYWVFTMIKYTPEDTSVCFAELPDEVALGINLSCCPHRCKGCHSPYLQTNAGVDLTESILDELIQKNQGITCVLFLGGDVDKDRLKELACYIRKQYNHEILVGWYSGEDSLDLYQYIDCFDYIKVGSYRQELGGLNKKTTNQRLYRLHADRSFVEDITSCFWV